MAQRNGGLVATLKDGHGRVWEISQDGNRMRCQPCGTVLTVLEGETTKRAVWVAGGHQCTDVVVTS